jgi:hypothetical protein
MSADYSNIKKAWNKLKLIRAFGVTGDWHAAAYTQLRKLARANDDALYEFIMSGEVNDEKELYELIFIGGHGGSVAKEDNLYWIPFLKRIRDNVDKLPNEMYLELHFDWLGKVHKYWDEETGNE